MKKVFLSIAIFVMAICADAQTNQYFWYQGNLIMGNPIAQIDSVTFGDGESTDTLHILLPRTIIKTVHDTIYITIHDTVCPNAVPEGALAGEFSVSPTKKVRFSKGNLQYNATLGTHQCADGTTKQGTWRFAENQYDTINTNYSNLSSSYDKWIDHFGWGCSGYNNLMPYCIQCYSTEESIANSYYDWGKYVPIINGGNTPEMWRTMTSNEWTYLFLERVNAATRIAFCSIDTKGGLILLPDIWDPTVFPTLNLGFNAYNTINQAQWEALESSGAVFLPIVGSAWPCSHSYTLQKKDSEILYWSTDNGYEGSAYYERSEIAGATSGHDPCDKIAVRLVQDIEE